MLDSFKDQVVWITGASSGIGEQIALNLSKYGAKLVLSARSKDKLYQVKNRCIGNWLKAFNYFFILGSRLNFNFRLCIYRNQ